MLETATSPEPAAARTFRRPTGVAVAATLVGILAAAVSMTGSWIPSLWGDEAATMTSATRPLVTLFPMLAHVDAVHGLYYLGMHFWTGAFGASPFSLRLPDALAVGACAAVVVLLVRRFLPLPYAVIAGVVTAVLPRMTYAGEEARSYAFDALIATLLCFIVVVILQRHPTSRRWWVAYAVTLALGVYLFFYLALMGVAFLLMILLTPGARPLLRRWTIVTAWTAVACLPMLALAILERNQISFLATQDAVNTDSVFIGMWFQDRGYAYLSWTLIVIAGAGYVYDRVRGSRAGAPVREPHLELVALCWLVIPMGVLIAVNPLIAAFTNRYGTLAAPAAAILMTLGVRRIAGLVPSTRAGRWIRGGIAAVLVVVIVAAAAPIWASQRTPYAKNHSDWNDIASYIRTHAQQGDGIVFDPVSRPSRRPRLAMSTDPGSFTAVRDIALKTPHVRSNTWYDSTYSIPEAASRGRFDEVDRVWLVEYRPGRSYDTWGETDLEALGYHRVRTVDGYSSAILLFTR